ncbi:MAG: DUF5678 domain-containing protein [Candidatus Aenigmarchaeota archaeon]|nr:DUF5678 domain-containing protein [Candidatus Aenigmarchaeota archaeon]
MVEAEFASFSDDAKWFYENFEAIQKKYSGKFVAVLKENENRLIEAESSFEMLLKKLKKKGIDPAKTFIEFVHKKGARIILY